MWELQYLQLCRFSFFVAYGMLVSQSGIEPSSPTLQGGCLPTGPPGKALWHAVSACFYTWYQKDTLFDGNISASRVAKIGHASRTDPHWSNTSRCLSQCSTIPCASSLITHWMYPIDDHHLLFQCSDTSSYSSCTLGQTHPVVYHQPALPSCDTNCYIIQTGKIHPVLY